MNGLNAPAARKPELAGYKRIEIDLRKQVAGRRWAVGAMLPSRRDLARQYGVSLVTLDRAIGPLLADGTLRADDRRGTFVLKLSASAPHPPSAQKPPAPALFVQAGLIGIITSLADDSAGQEYFILPELEQALSQQGFSTTVLNRVQDPSRSLSLMESVQAMLQEEISGLLIVCLDIDSRRITEELGRISFGGVPVVCIVAGELALPIPHVFYDNRSGGHQAALHLIAQGWPDLAVVAPFRASWVSERIAGVQDAVPGRSSSVRVVTGENRDWQVSDDPFPQGYAVMRAALAEGWRPSSLVCVNDGVAFGAISAAAEQGLLPGRDFAVLGFDDEARARVAGLTSLRPPMQSMAREAVRLLLSHRQGADTSLQVRLRAHIIPRASTRPRSQAT